jgi:SAM-dependent methyltransferase
LSSWSLFDELYERYEGWFERNRVTANNELLTVIRADPGQEGRPCLDIGSGTGFFTSALGCLGFEPSLGMARISRVRRGVNVVQGRAEAMPLRRGSVSSAFLIVTLCFLPRPEEAVLEASRVLRPGGWAVACIIPRESEWARFYMRKAEEGNPFYRVARFLGFEEVVSLFLSAGFRLEKAVGTLIYGPEEVPRPEEPRDYTGQEGFVCMRFKKAEPPTNSSDEEARKA